MPPRMGAAFTGNGPRILVVGENPWLLLSVVRALGAAGLRAAVLASGARPPVRWSRHCTGYTQLGSSDLERAREEVARHRPAFDLAIPADVFGTRVLRGLETRFPIPSPGVVDDCADKARFALAAQRLGIAHPRTEVIADRAAFAARPFAPCVLKPANGGNSEGVRYIDSPEAKARYLKEEDRGGQLLAQDYLHGAEIDCSVLAVRGEVVVWTCQRSRPDPLERELLVDEEALALARHAVRALGYHGAGHFDLRRDAEGKLAVLELNPRFWMSLQFSVWAGVNFAEAAVRVALGEQVQAYQFVPGVYRQPTLRTGVKALASELIGWGPAAMAARQLLRDPLPQVAQRLSRAR